MDEAHALKDKNSFRWKNLMSVARNANQRLMLTGTPLQNDLHVCIAYRLYYRVNFFLFGQFTFITCSSSYSPCISSIVLWFGSV